MAVAGTMALQREPPGLMAAGGTLRRIAPTRSPLRAAEETLGSGRPLQKQRRSPAASPPGSLRLPTPGVPPVRVTHWFSEPVECSRQCVMQPSPRCMQLRTHALPLHVAVKSAELQVGRSSDCCRGEQRVGRAGQARDAAQHTCRRWRMGRARTGRRSFQVGRALPRATGSGLWRLGRRRRLKWQWWRIRRRWRL